MFLNQSKIRRINLLGGPGVSKSTTAAFIFTNLKRRIASGSLDIQVELVTEYVKQWAWEGRKPTGLDQWYLFASQCRAEEIVLRNDVDLVISDSPLTLNCCYAKKNNVPGWENLFDLAKIFESKYPSINILLQRKDRKYISRGRFENKEQAQLMDLFIEENVGVPLLKIDYEDSVGIMNAIQQNCLEASPTC